MDRARRLLRADDDALLAGVGAVAVDGNIVDDASRRLAEAMLARAQVECYGALARDLSRKTFR